MASKNIFFSKIINYKHFIIFIISFSFIYGLDDNESWTSLVFKKKLSKKTGIQFEQEVRLNNQLSTFKQTFSEINLFFKLFDNFGINIPYRYSNYNDKNKQRVAIGGVFQVLLKSANLKYRLKLQRTFEDNKNYEDFFRNKFTVEYKLNKKIEPYCSYEIFNSYDIDELIILEKRLSLGLTYNLKNKKSIKIFYLLKNDDLIKINQNQTNIFSLSYRYKI